MIKSLRYPALHLHHTFYNNLCGLDRGGWGMKMEHSLLKMG